MCTVHPRESMNGSPALVMKLEMAIAVNQENSRSGFAWCTCTSTLKRMIVNVKRRITCGYLKIEERKLEAHASENRLHG